MPSNLLRDLSDNDLVVLDALARGASSVRGIKSQTDGALNSGTIRRVLNDLVSRGLVGWRLDDSWRIRKRGRAALQGDREHREERPALLADPIVRKAVGSIQDRSERQLDIDQLVLTFVDSGITEQLDNGKNQIIYGRRGTGKTHVLRVLESAVTERPNETALYLDLRQLGHSALFEDKEQALHVRVTALLKDVLTGVHDALVDYATGPRGRRGQEVGDALERFLAAMRRSSLEGEIVTIREQTTQKSGRETGLGLTTSGWPSLGLTRKSNKSRATTADSVREGTPLDHIRFAEIASSLDEVLRLAGLHRFHLLLDEWIAVPVELQPMLAEFLKRALFTVPRATVKIAALEYRSNFATRIEHGNRIGFELGADISTSLDLDDYLIYDRSPKQTSMIFSELLYRHVGTEADVEAVSRAMVGGDDRNQSLSGLREGLRMAFSYGEIEPEYLLTTIGLDGADALIDALFESRAAFCELVKASEGVIRDFIHIFSGAFFHTYLAAEPRIRTASVRRAAHEWYEKDKAPEADEAQAALLAHIAEEVIGKRRARTFLLHKRYEKDDAILSLFDLRLLHLVKRGYPDPDQPTQRYNIYTLDYGFYVPLMGSPRAPSADFTTSLRSAEGAIAVEPQRFIRKIVLDGEEFQRLAAG